MFTAVAEVISREAGVSLELLKPETRLFHDLGIFGDDIDEIFRALGELRPIDWSAFCFDDYFYGEPHLFGPNVPLTKKGQQQSSKRPLTMAMLVAAVERGRWEDAATAV